METLPGEAAISLSKIFFPVYSLRSFFLLLFFIKFSNLNEHKTFHTSQKDTLKIYVYHEIGQRTIYVYICLYRKIRIIWENE